MTGRMHRIPLIGFGSSVAEVRWADLSFLPGRYCVSITQNPRLYSLASPSSWQGFRHEERTFDTTNTAVSAVCVQNLDGVAVDDRATWAGEIRKGESRKYSEKEWNQNVTVISLCSSKNYLLGGIEQPIYAAHK